ncbi:hypothetical protein GCM10007385_46100 [Tateyamaria omphalii]|uniref:glycine-rich domain-containing protein-like n=1 Tax=Tateyamaria omphalii TaxID=299262 RepID=UPI001671F4ED|nr:glycine-rich domain-containing protein-like [Tateyamaria omphalii]GGX72075.1 hypothetical protein GCM10007385_46100 [Tateyamaria omphalii]
MENAQPDLLDLDPSKDPKLAYIDGMDFELLADRLCEEDLATELDPLMDRDLCSALIQNYKRFLKLNLIYKSQSLRPTMGIDVIWHYHILDTKRYIADCRHVFGAYLHHIPSYHRSAEPRQTDTKGVDMDALFQKHFGTSIHVHYAGRVY